MGFAEQLRGLRLQGGTRQGEHVADVTLIARRSLRRPGCRQWRRGVDLDAAVANFVESEQLVVIDGGMVQASYVQARRAQGVGWVVGVGGVGVIVSEGVGQLRARAACENLERRGSAARAHQASGTVAPPHSLPTHNLHAHHCRCAAPSRCCGARPPASNTRSPSASRPPPAPTLSSRSMLGS